MAFADKIGLALQTLQGNATTNNYTTFANVSFEDFTKLVGKSNTPVSGLFPTGKIVSTSIDEKVSRETNEVYKVVAFSVSNDGITYNKDIALSISDEDWTELNKSIEAIKAENNEDKRNKLISEFKNVLYSGLTFEVRENKDTQSKSLRAVYQKRTKLFTF